MENEVNEYSVKFIALYKSGIQESILSSDGSGLPNVNEEADSDESKKTQSLYDQKREVFMALLDLSSNPRFKAYISQCNLEPYDIVSINDLVAKPYLYFALRSYHKESKSWKINIDSVNEYLSELSVLKNRLIKKNQEFSDSKKDDGKNAQKAPKEPETARPNVPKGALDSIILLDVPKDFNWQDLNVGFGDENCSFDFKIVGSLPLREVRTFKEMGFENQKTKNKPIKEWDVVLGALARNNGIINVDGKNSYLAEWISNTNDRLKLFFKIEDNLIYHVTVKDHTYYKSKFKIYFRK